MPFLTTRPPFARALLTAALLLASLLLFPIRDSVAASRYTVVSSAQIAPGLTYRAIKDSQGPRRIFVLTVTPSEAVTMDVALAKNQLGHVERTSSMASRHGAVAAVNGDFGAFSGRPSYGYAEDGDLKIRPVLGGPRNFAIRKDETQSFVGGTTFSTRFVEVDSNERWTIQKWNYSTPRSGEIAAYTKAGGAFAKPPRSQCYARLRPMSALAWVGSGLGREYSVARRVCQTTPLLPGDTEGVVILAAKPGTSPGNQLKTLTSGEKVRLLWSFKWSGVMDVMGGVPMLMQGGSIVATNCSVDLCKRHPRTGVGRRPDGKLLLVVVDGRRTGWSIGYTLLEFAQLFKWLGAQDAMNLDGGGSSTMVVKGAIKNRPSDGSERAIVNSLLVLPRADGAEPKPTNRFQAATVTAQSDSSSPGPISTAERRSLLAAAVDPGSSGGMVDAVMRGALGPRPATLPPDLADVLERYRER
ncbi:MAG: phosphodiester glycosidase family protein [Actinomycetota bacterium]|nr:phosphodiester glycosidase family protein [Actinomycetota bacterium]